LHAASAEAMEVAWAGKLSTVTEALANHWEAGERWDRAATYLLQAARDARGQYGLDHAFALADRAWRSADRIAGPTFLAVDALTLLGDLLSLKGPWQKYRQTV
jgi:hypothetical protein